MIDPAHLITHLGGIALGSRLQDYGISRATLARHVDKGKIERIRAGVFAVPELQPSLREAVAHGGALTCTSVLRSHKVWVLHEGAEPHIWMGASGKARAHTNCTCVSHYYRGNPPLGTATVEQALLHLYRCQGEEAFFAAFESAWNLALLSRSARSRIRSTLPASARWIIDIARPDADSGLESLLRVRLHILGIRLDCQVEIDDVGSVDFVIDGRLILEADGKANHASPQMRHKDLKRDAAASARGYETLRFDYAQLIHDWASVQAAIIGALNRLRDHA